MEGYTQFFGGDQPNLPARSVIGVSALANPGFLVEIEVIAVAAKEITSLACSDSSPMHGLTPTQMLPMPTMFEIARRARKT